jgi:hypothetical protein
VTWVFTLLGLAVAIMLTLLAGLRVRTRELPAGEAILMGLASDRVWSATELAWRSRRSFVIWCRPVRRRYD